MKRWGAIAIALAVAAGVAAGAWHWRSHSSQREAQRQFQTAQRLVFNARYPEALAFIHSRRIPARESIDITRAWIELELTALEQMEPPPLPQLAALYDRFPEAFRQHEAASLHVARALLDQKKISSFHQLREHWRDRATRLDAWLALDADAFVVAGNPELAWQFLNDRPWPGPAEAERLGRLAFLCLSTNVAAARQFLEQARAADPHNAKIRSFLGRVLEQLGEKRLAEIEYATVHLDAPENDLLRDQLAEFFRRYGKYEAALRVWGTGLTNRAAHGVVWLKSFFWNRMVQPLAFPWEQHSAPDGHLQPLLNYLRQLPPNALWQEEAFQKIPEARRFQAQRQEIFWLRLLDALKAGATDQALELLRFNKFRNDSWQPEIESALLRILTCRASGKLEFPFGLNIPLNPTRNPARHPLFEQLDAWTHRPNEPIPESLEKFLSSDEVFVAVFLAAGWREAALRLRGADKVPEHFPSWYAFDLANAIRVNRGVSAALDFVRAQDKSKPLQVLEAELSLAKGETETAIALLDPLARESSDVGLRAAWFLSLAYLRLNQPALAALSIQHNPRGPSSVAGREILARVALIEKRFEEADAIYKAIAAESIEAKSHLARRAFAEKDFQQARQWTEQLLTVLPGQPQLEANLAAIAKAEAGQ
jgi:hypothetical protein